MINFLTVLKFVTLLSTNNQNNNLNDININYDLNKSIDNDLKINDHQSHVILNNEIIQLGWEKNSNGNYRLKQIPTHIKKVPNKLPEHITDISYAFKNNTNHTILGIEKWDTSKVVNMSGVFYNAQNFNTILNWDTSSVTDMSYMFYNTKNFNAQLTDKFVANNVKNMQSMFENAERFNQQLDKSFITNKEVNRSNMFKNAKRFNQDLSLGEFKETNLKETVFKNTESLIKENQALSSIDDTSLINLKNELISFWNENIKNKQLKNTTYETILELLKLNVKEKFKDLNLELTSIKDNVKTLEDNKNQIISIKVNKRFIVDLEFGNVLENDLNIKTDMSEISSDNNPDFNKISESLNTNIIKKFVSENNSLESKDVNDYMIMHRDFASAIIKHRISNKLYVVTFKINDLDLIRMVWANKLYGSRSLLNDQTLNTNLQVRHFVQMFDQKLKWYTPKMYHNIKIDDYYNRTNKPNVYTIKGKNIIYTHKTNSIFNLYCDIQQQNNFIETIYIDTNGKERRTSEDMHQSKFDNVKVIKRIGNRWDDNKKTVVAYRLPKNVEVVPEYLFPEIESLQQLFKGCVNFDQDISMWDTRSVSEMTWMFNDATKFNNASKPLNWTVSNVNNMGLMFGNAVNFNADISSWRTINVTNFGEMFRNAKVFNQNISKWNVNRANNFNNMFNQASEFNQNLRSWNVKEKRHDGFDSNTPAWKEWNRVIPSSLKQLPNLPQIMYGINPEKLQSQVKFKLAKFYNIDVNSLKLEAKPNNKISISLNNNSRYNQLTSPIEISYTSKEKLDQVIELNTNIGFVKNNSTQAIIDQLKKVFNILKDEEIKVENITNNSAKIRVINSKVFDSNQQNNQTTIRFDLMKDLSNIEFNTKEIVIETNDEKLFINEFIKRNQKVLNDNNIDLHFLKFEKKENFYEISIDNGEYANNLKVNYKVIKPISKINGLITDIGKFNTHNNSEIIKEFIRLNNQKLPGIDANDLELVKENNKWKIRFKPNSKNFSGEVNVTFTIRTNISQNTDTNAGAFDELDHNKIIDAFIRMNQHRLNGLTKDNFKIVSKNNNSITVEVQNNDDFYGQVTITYSIRQNVNDLTINTQAGKFKEENHNKIINAFIEKNKDQLPGLNRENFHVINRTHNSILVRIKNDDRFMGDILINFKTNHTARIATGSIVGIVSALSVVAAVVVYILKRKKNKIEK
ncbi:BspA family leucine-rich repeat surface protein [Mycoplasma cottewii]|uniref:BspA family leucine-rich repeat surface protein n=1 Tax=Mycoplasma cottewii TaxID=51364 RepID=A0ABY5TVN9_9MOLU|nr:BspA family leucine-rich repeat surface protein [Mycoplasma cottewii]UWD34738.1 BspA family leucine-rich repeat surface protein [Mycoplasma cottewii]